jgi:hypothetical protein
VPENVRLPYPSRSRYTLQWLATPDPTEVTMAPNNTDAAFKKRTGKPKPSEVLLHYNYCAAASGKPKIFFLCLLRHFF